MNDSCWGFRGGCFRSGFAQSSGLSPASDPPRVFSSLWDPGLNRREQVFLQRLTVRECLPLSSRPSQSVQAYGWVSPQQMPWRRDYRSPCPHSPTSSAPGREAQLLSPTEPQGAQPSLQNQQAARPRVPFPALNQISLLTPGRRVPGGQGSRAFPGEQPQLSPIHNSGQKCIVSFIFGSTVCISARADSEDLVDGQKFLKQKVVRVKLVP